MMKTALITGASAGIGLAFAQAYARRGHQLVLVARRADRLAELAQQLQSDFSAQCLVVVADLSEPRAVDTIAARIEQQGWQVDVLVNNAGYGVPGSFTDHDWNRHARTLELMAVSLTELCHRFLPGMREQGYGRIINVASVAGLLPGTAGHTLYEGIKAYVIRLSESLAFENADSGVNVSALCPGFTYSEFHDVTGTREQVSRFPDSMWWQAQEVVEAGIAALEAGKPVYVPGWSYRMIIWLSSVLPRPLVHWLLNRQSRRFRKA